jgi:hypothetical protein
LAPGPKPDRCRAPLQRELGPEKAGAALRISEQALFFESKKQRDDFWSSFGNQSRELSLQLLQERPAIGTADEWRVYLCHPTWLEA